MLARVSELVCSVEAHMLRLHSNFEHLLAKVSNHTSELPMLDLFDYCFMLANFKLAA